METAIQITLWMMAGAVAIVLTFATFLLTVFIIGAILYGIMMGIFWLYYKLF